MDDNKENSKKNQTEQGTPQNPNAAQPEEPQTIFETVPENQQPAAEPESNLQPEEIAPDVTAPSPEIVSPSDQQIPSDTPPMVYEEGKNKFIFIIAGIVTFVIFLAIFVMFFGGGKKGTSAVTLNYWGLWEDKSIFDPLIQQYEKQNPNVSITYQRIAPQDYREKLLARSKNGQGPDIFRFNNTWLPEIKDVVTAIPDSIMTNADFEKTFYKVQQNDLKVGSYYYGIPLEIDGLVLIYNDNLFKKAGIQTAPATWDELISDVTKLTVKDQTGTLITAGIALGTTSNVEYFSDIFGLMLLQNGGSLQNLDQQEAVGALQSYRKFAEDPQAFWNDNMPDSLNAFIQEKVAMIIAPSWVVLNIKAANPDIGVKVVPVPTVPGTTPITLANYWVEGVSRYSKNQLEAWKFLKYLVQKDNLTKLYEQESKVRLFGEPYSRVDLAPLLAQNEYLGAVIKQADNMRSLPLVSRTYDNGLNDEIIQYIQNAINATIQGVSYSEALQTAKSGVAQVLSKYQISSP